MDHETQVGKNFAWGFFSQVITRIFGFVFFVYMSHVLLERGMGQYNFVVSFVAFWFIFSDFGVSNYLYREWAKDDVDIEKIKKDFNVTFTLKCIMSTIIFVPFSLMSWWVNKDIFIASILYYLFVFLSLTISLIETYFNSISNFRLSALRTLIEKAVIIMIGGIALYFFRTIDVVFVAMVISQLFALAYYFTGRFPFIPSISLDIPRMKDLIKKGVPFALFAVFISIYGRIDVVMLKFITGFETVGWYAASYKAYEIANIFPGILFIPAIFPILSRIYNSQDRKKFQDFFNRSLRVLYVVSLLLSVSFVFLAPLFINVFFPESFAPSILGMRIIVLVLTAASLSWLFANLLVIQNKEKTSIKIIIASAITNIILNIFLIPKYSLYGAAWSTVIAEVFNLYLFQRYADWDKDKRLIGKMGVIVLFTAFLLFSIKIFGYMNNILVALMSFLILILLLKISGLIQRGDIDMFYLPMKNKIKVMFFTQNEI